MSTPALHTQETVALPVAWGADFLREVLESLPDGVDVVDGNGTVSYSNRDRAGRRWAELWAGDADGAILAARACGTGRFLSSGVADGRKGRDWDVRVTAAGGALVCVSRDVTESRRAEAEAADRARSADLELIWSVSNDVLCVADREGRFLSVNPAFERILGWTAAEATSRRFFDFLHPDDVEGTRAADGSLGERPVTDFENRYRHRDGTYRWLSWSAIERDGTVYASARDVTARVAEKERSAGLEAQLRQARKMEAVGQLTGGIAHDFNNLLTGITAGLDLLSSRIGKGGGGQDLRRYVEGAQDSARRAAALTHRLLAFSRKQPLEPRPVDVDDLVNGMATLIRRATGHAIGVKVVPDAGAPPVLVDPNQLENALLNLCINARDAMPDGGTLVVTTGVRDVSAERGAELDLAPGRYVTLGVTDDGCGMSPEVLARATEPFFTTKPTGVGTGLGLSMTTGFVRQSGGAVCVESAPDVGTSVTLYLPRHLGPREAVVPAKGRRPPPGKGETVLLVEDDPSVRTFAAEALRDLGYRVVEAEDAPEALDAFEAASRIDLVVVDVGLPGRMDGTALADALRTMKAGLAVLAISGYARDEGDGPDAVLRKPFAMEALGFRVAETLAAARVGRPLP